MKKVPKNFNHEEQAIETLATYQGFDYSTWYIDLLRDNTFYVSLDDEPHGIFKSLKEAREYIQSKR
ncbi:MAG TPA: hypothetical protein VFM79_08225 [Pelobium sp.]|nr:hypothetical protein [Pelobium sp.]